ncbi:integration host factor, actinobacterial type [Streptomyces sp. NBC_00212]|uniref:integration host factor, actinobacterial type n=1 Tax=Streptomyces sp. NBC_00212 TaxID=2975684 RepID=UPI00325021BB
MVALPPLTLEQRRAALDKATAARRERAGVKDALKHGSLSLPEVLASDSEAVRKMPVRVLLEALPGIGSVRAGQLISDLGISERRRVRGLGTAQRARLLALFPPRD